MSGYAYGPPPPPPPLATSHATYAQPRGPYPHHGHGRGGGSSGGRGRGAQHGRGRGDYHAASTPPVHYEYAAQQGPPHNSPPYAAQHAPTVAFSPHPQQWTPEHGHVPHPPNAHPHAPAPISASNYHPNYAPQAYPPSQYAQQPPYGPPQHYGYQAPAQPPAPQHWAPHQGHYAGGRGRGGFGDRLGSKPPHGGVPVRHGYEHEPVVPVGGALTSPSIMTLALLTTPLPIIPIPDPRLPPLRLSIKKAAMVTITVAAAVMGIEMDHVVEVATTVAINIITAETGRVSISVTAKPPMSGSRRSRRLSVGRRNARRTRLG